MTSAGSARSECLVETELRVERHQVDFLEVLGANDSGSQRKVRSAEEADTQREAEPEDPTAAAVKAGASVGVGLLSVSIGGHSVHAERLFPRNLGSGQHALSEVTGHRVEVDAQVGGVDEKRVRVAHSKLDTWRPPEA